MLHSSHGSYLVKATPEWSKLTLELAEHIAAADLSLGDYRFLFLRLLWEQQGNKQLNTIFTPTFLTAGQRSIVLRTEKLLTRDLGKRYVIRKLAENQGVSPATLKKHFAIVFGKSISIYLKECRIEKAKELLATSKRSIEEIPNAVGYENQGKFAVMFREENAVTPTEYRRIHRVNDSNV